MANKLDGSFSGLWTCELCSKTGDECTCEHFNRDSAAHGPDKTLTDAELAAELWYAISTFSGAVMLDQIFADDPEHKAYVDGLRDKMYTLQEFADGEDLN